MGPRCFKCLMFSPSGPVELVFLVNLRAAEVCAIVMFMGVVGSPLSVSHSNGKMPTLFLCTSKRVTEQNVATVVTSPFSL